MALNLIKQITVLGQRSLIRNSLYARFSKLYEPDYLETGKSKVPLMPTVNIQIRSYDYPVLEKYQEYIHKLADIIQVDIDDSWAMPPEEFKVQRYKGKTTVIAATYNFKLYERNIQISEISSIKCSALIRILEAILPQGVNLNVDVFSPELDKKRYVPDKELLDLKSTLDTLKSNK
ncbi:PREDICTED: 39S ribosomal protein L48, mitochondrial [Dinoponera quadriceps]|uniref:39S ribosomal protein L48, mitochondrial n=1 Tax=Dinoponera quadriceps TaxID=609295 RepID=A0A6P3XZJ8_DINQU|nr:PREDICTED: 39S ribosomal protein L48, mitochondrial [Dinoponera quadriceps]